MNTANSDEFGRDGIGSDCPMHNRLTRQAPDAQASSTPDATIVRLLERRDTVGAEAHLP
jgi:hypothetical protein